MLGVCWPDVLLTIWLALRQLSLFCCLHLLIILIKDLQMQARVTNGVTNGNSRI
jgi:hypothetical protein